MCAFLFIIHEGLGHLSRFREELLEAFVIVMLDQQEIESAELELSQLRRQADVRTHSFHMFFHSFDVFFARLARRLLS